jgi:hypothetical protein
MSDNNDDYDDEDNFKPLLDKPKYFVDSSKDGIRLAVRQWIPPDEDKISQGNSLLVHHGGCGWHSGYFDGSEKVLQKNSIGLVAYDQVGSGYSDSIGGRRQYFDSIDTVPEMILINLLRILNKMFQENQFLFQVKVSVQRLRNIVSYDDHQHQHHQ